MALSLESVFLLVVGLVISLCLSYFQYYFKSGKQTSTTLLLFSLRSLGLLMMLMAFFNPDFSFKTFEIDKPKLRVLVDNSQSLQKLNQEDELESTVASISSNNLLNEKFDISYFRFSEELELSDSLTFSGKQTNIGNALLQLDQLANNTNEATILLSDGNQTLGYDYKNISLKNPVYPVVYGDTAQYEDLAVSRVNVNKYTFLGNEFPIEIYLGLTSNNKRTVPLLIKSNGRVVKRQKVELNPNSSKRINFTMKSQQKGNRFFTVEVGQLQGEVNTINNRRDFSIEVIDQKSEVIIVSNLTHPDLGTLKRSIESNKKRSVTISRPNEIQSLEAYQAVILYQPDENFKQIITEILDKEKNVFIVSGTQTDYSFLNNLSLGFKKNTINDIEMAAPFFNKAFLPYQQADIGFSDLPPLKDAFGQISIDKDHDILLFQRINGIETNQILLGSIKINTSKLMILFGEGIWAWRNRSYLRTSSFQDFDRFVDNIIQFIANSERKERLNVTVQPSFYANEPIVFNAEFYDENYQFDENASLQLKLTNAENNETVFYPFAKSINNYQIIINNLVAAQYKYEVKEVRTGIAKKGSIKILSTQIENQFTSANINHLNLLASNTNGQVFLANQTQQLFDALLSNTSMKAVQKTVEQERSLLDWWYYLMGMLGFFTAEWFVRKYNGLI